jgi:hypothetical protein
MMARSTFRPIRPKPLIATLTVIVISLLARTAVFGCWLVNAAPVLFPAMHGLCRILSRWQRILPRQEEAF